ncbi:MAG TPA: hypothetical protein VFX59_14195 [Polyangiales bacterium]|nr:hypothetical protein [Polyangiales bacterium]
MATVVLFVACNKGEQEGTTSAARSEPQPIVRKACTDGTPQTVDVNNDGRPDITHRVNGGKRVCSEIDLNFDGRPDLGRFYDKDGTSVGFEQHDYDFDGKPDDSIFYKAGQVERKELDTNFDGLVDTWLWCKGSLVDKAERARRKPGRVDTWEVYENGQLAEVRYDENNDGVVEKWDKYKGGALFETQLDTNMDGKADRTESAEADSDASDERVSCDGNKLPAVPQPAPGSGNVFNADGGVLTAAPTTAYDAGAYRALPPIPSDAGMIKAGDAGVPSDAGRSDAGKGDAGK